ncbi:MAG: hypothetical protein KDC27_00460, partial [Acidobacteria bacterium]|nr:hypothetical protein [Acidobacteriota bacterium]
MRRLSIALLVLACAGFALAETREIEVRVVQGKLAPGALAASDLVITQGGKPAAVLDVRYVPPVEQWRDDPSLAEPTWIYILNQTNTKGTPCFVLPGVERFLGSELPPGVQISVAGLPFTHQRKPLRSRIPEWIEASTWGNGGWQAATPPDVDRKQLGGYDANFEDRFAALVYGDLFARLAKRRGKKVVVLLRSERDVPVPPESLQALSVTAARNRVTLQLGMYPITEATPDRLSRLVGSTGGQVARYVPTRRVQTQGSSLSGGGMDLPMDMGMSSPTGQETSSWTGVGIASPFRLSGSRPGAKSRPAATSCRDGFFAFDMLQTAVQSAGDYYVVRFESAPLSATDAPVDVTAPRHRVELSSPGPTLQALTEPPPPNEMLLLKELLDAPAAAD